jgi:hypothetical protein
MGNAIEKPVRERKKQQRGRDLNEGRRREPKELTRGDWGSRGKLAAACRKVSRRATAAWRKRNASRKIRTQVNCGSRQKLDASRIRVTTRCTGIAQWNKQRYKRQTRKQVERWTRRAGTRQEGKIGRKDLGGRRPLYLRRKRTTTDGIREWISEQPRLKSERTTSEIYWKTIGLEAVKRATEMSTGLLKLRNWTLWRSRPPPKRKKNPLAVLT